MFGIIFNKHKLLSNHKALGRWGEKRCEKYLKKQGYQTLAKNYLYNHGELDLVMAAKDGTVVFVEVKTRANEDFTPAEYGLTGPKKDALSRTARHFLKNNNIEDRPRRFDFVTIVLDQKAKETIKHYENAFTV